MLVLDPLLSYPYPYPIITPPPLPPSLLPPRQRWFRLPIHSGRIDLYGAYIARGSRPQPARG